MEKLKSYRFGLFCSNSDNSYSTNHTFMLKSLSYENIETKVKHNIDDLDKLLQLCTTNGYDIFRLGNSFIPFLSHIDFKPEYLDRLDPLLKKAKNIISRYNLRITMHPSQFVVLNSKDTNVIDKSLHELKLYFWLFDRLGINDSSIILIHGGGAYGDKVSAMDRFVDTIAKNPWLKSRLAIENDDKIYTAEEIHSLCSRTGLPFVFDIYHHNLNPSHFDKEQFIHSWGKRIPKVHISSKGEGRFGKHADFIDVKDFYQLEDLFGDDIEQIDIMIEAKQKELAIDKLRNDLRSNMGLKNG